MTDVEYELNQIVAGMQAIGHPIADADSIDRCRRILTGELTEEQAAAEITAKHSPRISELAAALTGGMLTEGEFTVAVVLLPGPSRLSELHTALARGQINAAVHDTALAAMIAAGHEA